VVKAEALRVEQGVQRMSDANAETESGTPNKAIQQSRECVLRNRESFFFSLYVNTTFSHNS